MERLEILDIVLILLLLYCSIHLPVNLSSNEWQSVSYVQAPRVLIIIGLHESPDWRDKLVFLVAPLASAEAKERITILLQLDKDNGEYSDPLTEAAEYFLKSYNPYRIYIIGDNDYNPDLGNVPSIEIKYIKGENYRDISANIIFHFWNYSKEIVLVKSNDEISAMMGVSIASLLHCPLMYVEDFSFLKRILDELAVEHAFVLGNYSDIEMLRLEEINRNVTMVNDIVSMGKILTRIYTPEYFIVTNIRDAYISKAGRLSLISPILASYRHGIVLPLNITTGILQFKPVSLIDSPMGIPIGNVSMYLWKTEDKPSTNEVVYPVNQYYRLGRTHIEEVEVTYYLCASHENSTNFDLFLIDLNNDNFIQKTEIFRVGETFTLQIKNASFKMRLTKILQESLSHGPDYSDVILQPLTFSLECVEVDGERFSVLLGSYAYPIYVWNKVFIDLDHDNYFGDPGEGPYGIGDQINIKNKVFELYTINSLYYPGFRYMMKKINDFLENTGILPKFLTIVGWTDSIPYGTGNLQTDSIYGLDPSEGGIKIAVGRIVSLNIFEASILLARTINYDLLINSKSVTITTGFPPTPAFSSSIAADISYRYELENFGFDVAIFFGNMPYFNLTYDRLNAYASKSIFIIHDGHGASNYLSLGVTSNRECLAWNRNTFPRIDAPAILFSTGCEVALLDDPKENFVTYSFQRGVISIIGSTKVSSHLTHYLIHSMMYFILYKNQSIGEAFKNGINLLMTVGIDHCIELLGDPALKPHLPMRPKYNSYVILSEQISKQKIRGNNVLTIQGKIIPPNNTWNISINIVSPRNWKPIGTYYYTSVPGLIYFHYAVVTYTIPFKCVGDVNVTSNFKVGRSITFHRANETEIFWILNAPEPVEFTLNALVARTCYIVSIDVQPKVTGVKIDDTQYLQDQVPVVFEWMEDSMHTVEVPATVQSQPGVRYIFEGWSDNVTSARRTINVSSSISYLAKYRSELLVSINSSYSTPSGGGWYKNGSIATITISETLVDHDNGTRRVFKGWFEDSSFISDRQSFSIVVNRPIRVVAHWDTEYEVSTSLAYSFTVSKPVSLTASWRTEMNLTLVGVIIGIILLIVIVAIVFLKRRKQTRFWFFHF